MTAPAVILSHPQIGENIGAAARAMKNFGLTELRLIAPQCRWPNERASALGGSPTTIPFLLVHDAVECWAIARGALRYRTLVL